MLRLYIPKHIVDISLKQQKTCGILQLFLWFNIFWNLILLCLTILRIYITLWKEVKCFLIKECYKFYFILFRPLIIMLLIFIFITLFISYRCVYVCVFANSFSCVQHAWIWQKWCYSVHVCISHRKTFILSRRQLKNEDGRGMKWENHSHQWLWMP